MYYRKLKKWTLARCQNKNFIYGLFRDMPDRVEILQDNSEMYELILLRKDYFEKLTHRENLDIKLICEVLKEIPNITDAQKCALERLKEL